MVTTTDGQSDPDAEDFGWSLGVLLRSYRAALGAVLGDLPHGHRGYQVLITVERGEHSSQLALATYLGIDRTVMTYLLDDLVTAGLVERRVDTQDRRQRKVVLTGRGGQVLDTLTRQVGHAEDTTLGALTPAERTAFRAMLRRVACEAQVADPQQDPCEVVDEMLSGTTSHRTTP